MMMTQTGPSTSEPQLDDEPDDSREDRPTGSSFPDD